jgi:proteasome lid subunit RPN8/RPN11
MTLKLDQEILRQIQAHGEASYPLEGAGLLLGRTSDSLRIVIELNPLANRFEQDQQHRRYRLDPLELMRVEDNADERGLDVLGVFHSHPDHAAIPSAYDLEWSLPYYSYLITGVAGGRATETRSWRLVENRERFEEEAIILDEQEVENQ